MLGIAVLAGALVAGVGVIAFSGGGGGGGYSTEPASWRLPKLDGPGQVSLAGLRGRPVVVNFFASWCTACRSELPVFATDARALRGRLSVVEVDSLETGNGLAMARQFHLARAGALLARDVGGADASGLHDALGGGSDMPITAFYDQAGRLLGTHIGAYTATTLATQLGRLYGLPAPGG